MKNKQQPAWFHFIAFIVAIGAAVINVISLLISISILFASPIVGLFIIVSVGVEFLGSVSIAVGCIDFCTTFPRDPQPVQNNMNAGYNNMNSMNNGYNPNMNGMNNMGGMNNSYNQNMNNSMGMNQPMNNGYNPNMGQPETMPMSGSYNMNEPANNGMNNNPNNMNNNNNY